MGDGLGCVNAALLFGKKHRGFSLIRWFSTVLSFVGGRSGQLFIVAAHSAYPRCMCIGYMGVVGLIVLLFLRVLAFSPFFCRLVFFR